MGRVAAAGAALAVVVLVAVTPAGASGGPRCLPGPNCLYPARITFPSYGGELGICTFAAAAYWEQVVLERRPDPNVIASEFAQAGGTQDGIVIDTFIGFWQQHGIDGVVLTALHATPRAPASVKRGVRASRALLALFRFAAGDRFGPYTEPAGQHLALVDGFTPAGPLVVSWGSTIQLTWAQWRAEALSAWRVDAAPPGGAAPERAQP